MTAALHATDIASLSSHYLAPYFRADVYAACCHGHAIVLRPVRRLRCYVSRWLISIRHYADGLGLAADVEIGDLFLSAPYFTLFRSVSLRYQIIIWFRRAIAVWWSQGTLIRAGIYDAKVRCNMYRRRWYDADDGIDAKVLRAFDYLYASRCEKRCYKFWMMHISLIDMRGETWISWLRRFWWFSHISPPILIMLHSSRIYATIIYFHASILFKYLYYIHSLYLLLIYIWAAFSPFIRAAICFHFAIYAYYSSSFTMLLLGIGFIYSIIIYELIYIYVPAFTFNIYYNTC